MDVPLPNEIYLGHSFFVYSCINLFVAIAGCLVWDWETRFFFHTIIHHEVYFFIKKHDSKSR